MIRTNGQHEDTKNTMKIHPRGSLCSLCLCVVIISLLHFGYGFAVQQTTPQGTQFPDGLLEGNPNFNLAIMLQGDLRGNFGPCG